MVCRRLCPLAFGARRQASWAWTRPRQLAFSEGSPDVMVLQRGDQSVHLRGVAHFAMRMVEEFAASHPEIKIDRDIVLAGALCHDIGKPYEFDPVNRKRWAEDPSRAGDPCLR